MRIVSLCIRGLMKPFLCGAVFQPHKNKGTTQTTKINTLWNVEDSTLDGICGTVILWVSFSDSLYYLSEEKELVSSWRDIEGLIGEI